MDAFTRYGHYTAKGRPLTPRQARRGRHKARRALDWTGQLLFTPQPLRTPPELVPRG